MADDAKEKEKAEERMSPNGAIVYQAICKEGDDELKRSTAALAWSGLAAVAAINHAQVVTGGHGQDA